MEIVTSPSRYSGLGNRPWFDVTAYGATGNGVTDDSAAIQAALTAAAAIAAGGLVYIPAGTYVVGTALTCSNRFVTIQGAGKDSTKLSYTGNGVALTLGTTAGAGADSTGGVRDLTITGTGSGTSGLRIIVFNGGYLENLRVEDFTAGNGILFDGANCIYSYNVDVQNNLINLKFSADVTTPGNPYSANLNVFFGGQIKNGGQHVISTDSADGNKFYGTYFAVATTAPAINLEKANNWVFDGCMFESNLGGAAVAVVNLGAAGAATDANGCVFLNNFFTEDNAQQDHIRVTRGSRNVFIANIHSGPFTRACVRYETNANQCLAQWLYNSSSGGAAVISDGSGSVDHFAMGPGTTLTKNAVGYAFNDFITGPVGTPPKSRASQASTAAHEFYTQPGVKSAEVTEAGVFNSLAGGSKFANVGNVGGGTDDLMSQAVAAAALSANGKTVEIIAWGTTANNANAKTVTLNWGGQVIMTQALTISIAGTWIIKAYIVKNGSSTQKIFAELKQLATSLEKHTITAGTQTDTAAITVKCTGAATADNDIVQEGLIVRLCN